MTVAGLVHVTLGAFTELEQTKRVAVASLVQRAGVAVTVLFDDAKVARTTLHDASSVTVAQLLQDGFVAVQTLHEGIEEQAGGNGFVLFRRGAVDADGDGTGDDEHSWSYDGHRTSKWHNGSTTWGKSWSSGQVVGCAVDSDNL